MIKIEYGKYSQQFPEKWEELTAKQLVKCIGFIEAFPVLEAQLLIMHELCNRKFKRIITTIGKKALLEKGDDLFYTIQLNALRQVCNFMLEAPSFSKWNFPFLKIGLIKYVGPTDMLGNLTFGEFGRCEHYYNQYIKKQNIDALHKFMACFYRPKKYLWFGKRRPFTEDEINNYKVFTHISLTVKRAILLNFSATRENVFSRFKDGFSKGQQSKADKYGWDGVIIAIAAERHMLPNAISQRPLIEMLIEFDTLAIRNKEANEKKPTT